jgi:hypothetical protein
MDEVVHEVEQPLSECSHHTAVLGGERSDSDGSSTSFGLFSDNDWHPSESRKKTSKNKKRRKKKNLTTSIPPTDEAVMSSSEHHRDQWDTVTGPRKNKSRKQQSQSNAKPTFCKYPVIVEDLQVTSSATLSGLKWQLPDILRMAVGTVSSVKQISGNKFIVGCSDSRQQSRLVSLPQLGQIKVKSHLPVPTVQAVVSGIPLEVSNDEVLKRVGSFRDEDDNNIAIPVKDLTRLTNRSGSPSLAFRLTLETTKLPVSVMINKSEFHIKPYAPSVVRCFKCQQLGHLAKMCKAQSVVCATCGISGHTANKCSSGKKHCVNCNSDLHSSAYGGCSVRKTWCVANRLRSQSFMPRSTAFAQAKKLVANKQAGKVSSVTAPTQPPNSAWRMEASGPTTYAGVTSAGQRKSPSVSASLSRPTNSHSHQSSCDPDPALPLRSTPASAFKAQQPTGSALSSSDVQRHQPVVSSKPQASQTHPVPGHEPVGPHCSTNTSRCSSIVSGENSVLKAENDSLKKHISSLEKKLSEMSKSLSSLTEEVSFLRNQRFNLSESSMSTSFSSGSTSANSLASQFSPRPDNFPSSLIKVIESAILRIIPDILSNRQLIHDSVSISS